MYQVTRGFSLYIFQLLVALSTDMCFRILHSNALPYVLNYWLLIIEVTVYHSLDIIRLYEVLATALRRADNQIHNSLHVVRVVRVVPM